MPIVEGARCTFLCRGEADEVHSSSGSSGCPTGCRCGGCAAPTCGTSCSSCPKAPGSSTRSRSGAATTRAVQRPAQREALAQPGGQLVGLLRAGYETPDWALPDPEARPGSWSLTVPQPRTAARRAVTLYLPARFRRTATYPLLVVHDGGDFLQYAAAKIVLDNLIHRLDVAETVVAFMHPRTG